MIAEELREQIAGQVKEARQLCGCSYCRWGYDIGQRTLAARPEVDSLGRPALTTGARVPGSCVAAVVLEALLR